MHFTWRRFIKKIVHGLNLYSSAYGNVYNPTSPYFNQYPLSPLSPLSPGFSPYTPYMHNPEESSKEGQLIKILKNPKDWGCEETYSKYMHNPKEPSKEGQLIKILKNSKN
uniref:Uncharacterized protein n=1 Tax=Cacopsylla melanoneura TaxID=428564 RepID=A0A8D8XU89_9HEMI